MKRTAFKRQSYSLTKTKVKNKKKKVSNTKLLEKKIWELCKFLTRTTYGSTCYTCGKTGLVGSNWHTGHFLPKSVCGVYLKYDLRNLRPQCYNCNMNLGGNGAAYYRQMVKMEGKKYVETLFKDKERITKGDSIFYSELLERYTQLVQNLDK